MKKRVLSLLPLALVLAAVLCVPALALTEAEVEAQVAATSKEAVTGNVLIWFLCAVAFLKVSQKIDSFMATLGVNVGRTGGSLLAEAMIAMRAVTMVAGGGRGFGAGRAAANAGGAAGKSGSSGMAGFFKGGLVGMTGQTALSGRPPPRPPTSTLPKVKRHKPPLPRRHLLTPTSTARYTQADPPSTLETPRPRGHLPRTA